MPIIVHDPKRPPGGFREFFSLAYPLVISNASITIMVFVDRLFLSWANTENIAASLPTVVLLFTFWSVFLGISEYTNTFVAQFYGAERPRDIGKATWQGIYFSLASSILVFAFYPFGFTVLEWGGHAPEIVVLEKAYYSVFFFCGPFQILNGALSSFYSGRGKTKVIMKVNVAINLVNAFLDYALIFGRFGFPEMGIRGAALATTLATALATGIYFVLFVLPANDRIYQTRTNYRFDLNLMKRLIRFGFPSGVHFFLEVSAFSMFVFLIGRVGKPELAASNIALSLNMLAWFPMVGASIATTTLVGQYIGRRDYATAAKSAYTAFIAVELYMLSFALLYITSAESLIRIFQNQAEVPGILFEDILPLGKQILFYVALYQLFDAMLLTFSGALRGAGDTAFAMWACVICAWCIFVPGTWLVVEVLQWGAMSAWIWIFIYCASLGIVYLLRFQSGRWKQFDVIANESKIVF